MTHAISTPSFAGASSAQVRFDLLHAILVGWLATGCAAMICFPALRGSDPLFGWLPFWLGVAPLIDLGVLHRRSWPSVMRSIVARLQHRQRRAAPRQARTLRVRGSGIAKRGWTRAQSVIPSRLRSMRRRNSSMMRR
jgi:hypothetical protein